MAQQSKVDQFVNTLRNKILKGDYGQEGRLPEIGQLATQYGLSRSSAVTGINRLKAEGLIAGERSFYVKHVERVMTGVLQPFEKALRGQNLTPLAEHIIAPELLMLPDDIAAMFGQPRGLQVVHRLRRQGTSDAAYRLAEYWYLVSLEQGQIREMQDNPSADIVVKMMRARGYPSHTSHDEITVRFPTHQEMELLSITATTPVVQVLVTTYGPNKTVWLLQRIVFIASAVQLNYDCIIEHTT